MKKFIMVILIGVLVASLTLPAVSSELRKLGARVNTGLGVAGDIYLGNTCYTSPLLAVICGLNASHLSFFADNGVSLERLYPLVSDNTWRLFYRNGSGVLIPLVLGPDNTFLRSHGPTAAPTFDNVPAGSGSGDVTGPASSTDLAVAIYNGTTGKLIKNSLCTISASGTLTCPEFASSAPDNTRKGNVANTADPTSGLSIGDHQYNKTSKLWKFRNFDNTAWSEFFTSEGTNTGNFFTTGTLNGAMKVVAKTDNVTLSGAEVYGTLIECGAGCATITLPAKITGMSVCVMATDNVQKSVDVNNSDAIIYLDGTDFGNGHKATSTAAGATSPNGEFICLVGSATANKWRVTGRGIAAWTDGG